MSCFLNQDGKEDTIVSRGTRSPNFGTPDSRVYCGRAARFDIWHQSKVDIQSLTFFYPCISYLDGEVVIGTSFI